MASEGTASAAPDGFDRRIVTVLFADVVGFTPLSERFDAEDMATVQDAYFSATRETILRYGGVVEKFIGDAAMAVFGAPIARDDDAERAVRAGLALIGAIEQIGARLSLEPGDLQLRVGVNTGEVVHATIGPDAGRVTGDAVNTAARLQTAARPGSVLLGELTAMTVAETIDTRAVGALELKGKAAPIRTWQAIGARSQPSRDAALGALRGPMLGRARELGQLLESIARISRDRGVDRCLIVAPPGVGKSRLLLEFASATTAIVLRARVRPQGTAPYETVAQLFTAAGGDLADALESADIPAARREVILREVQRLFAAPAGAVRAGSDLAAERDARFDAWIAAFEALADGPVAWLVEDVHWAGGDLLAFLQHAGTAPSRAGRLVVTSTRPGLLETAAAWCEASGMRIDLGPLDSSDVRTLVRGLLGDALPDELIDAIADRSDGTPLFIEELLRTWVGVGTLVHEGEEWRLAMEPGGVTVPQTVQAIYAAQLDDLPREARQVARRGSVAGRRLPQAAFEPLELGAPGEGLEALRRRELLAGPMDDPITGASYVYRHALLRDAAYVSLTRGERARLHVAMAEWLERVAGDRVDSVAEAIAEHYALALESRPALAGGELPLAASLSDTAAAWYERAAEAALRLSAIDASRRLFARSIDLTADDAAIDRARRRLRLGQTLAASADLDLGIAELEAARESLRGEAAEELYEAATFSLGRAYLQQIRFPEAAAVCEAGIEHLGGGPPTPLTARLDALAAWALAANGESDGLAARADAAWLAVETGHDPIRQLDVLECRTAARDELDPAGPDDWVLMEERARGLERWHQVAVAGRVRATFVSWTDPIGALVQLGTVAEEAAAHGQTEQAGWVEYSRCEILWTLGDWDATLESGTRALDIAERYAYQRLAFRTFMVVLQVAAERHDAALAARWDRWWAEAEPHFPPSPSPYGRVLQGAYRVWLARATDRTAPMPEPELVDAILPMVNAHYAGAIETLVRSWLDAGRADLAGAAGARWTSLVAADARTPLVQISSALVDAWVSGSPASAQRAASMARALPAPWWESRAQELIG